MSPAPAKRATVLVQIGFLTCFAEVRQVQNPHKHWSVIRLRQAQKELVNLFAPEPLMSHQDGFSNNGTERSGSGKSDDNDDRMQRKNENVAHPQDGIKLNKLKNSGRLQNSPPTRSECIALCENAFQQHGGNTTQAFGHFSARAIAHFAGLCSLDAEAILLRNVDVLWGSRAVAAFFCPFSSNGI